MRIFDFTSYGGENEEHVPRSPPRLPGDAPAVTRRTLLKAAPLVTIQGLPLALAAPGDSKYSFTALDKHVSADTPVAGVKELVPGNHVYAGIPFQLARGFIALGRTRRQVTIPFAGRFGYICMAHFCEKHPQDTEGPFGAIRTYARLEKSEPFSFDAWARAIRAGRTFATCGPLLFLTVDGLEPGGELDIREPREVEVHVAAESLFPLGGIEIVRNGTVVASGASPLREHIRVDEPGWIAARCTSRDRLSYGMRNIGAHTSPVYVTRGGRGGFSVPCAEYMLKLMEGAIVWVDTLAMHAGREQAERIRRLFVSAQQDVQTRLGEHRHL